MVSEYATILELHAAVFVMDISLHGSVGAEKCSKAPLSTPLRLPKAHISGLVRLLGPRWASLGLWGLQGDSQVVSEYATILELHGALFVMDISLHGSSGVCDVVLF